jgi:hypothetical protein
MTKATPDPTIQSVLAATAAAVIALSVVLPAAHADQSPMFEQGWSDRGQWEQWFNGLPAGDYKTGAFYWASQRSSPNPGTCKQMNDEFYKGCTAAKVKLTGSDLLRNSEPDYKVGWNAWVAPVSAAPEASATPAPQEVPGNQRAPVVTGEGMPPQDAPVASAPDSARHTEPEASAPATPAPAPAQANTQWYLAKSGKDTCLPITEIHVGPQSIRTPEELAQAFRDMGQNARWDTTGSFGDRTKLLYVDPPQGMLGQTINIMMFNDRDFCKYAVEEMGVR